MGNNSWNNMDKVKHFTMEIPQVKNKMDKMERKLDVDTIFDKSGGKEVAIGKKSKKKDNNQMQMSFYNYKSKKYKKENS
jgi:hypothetical protein